MYQYALTLVIQDGQYILQHRDNKPGIAYPNMFSTWGGALEPGESPQQAAKRELEEETGLVYPEASFMKLGEPYKATKQTDPQKGSPVLGHLFYIHINSSDHVQSLEGQGMLRVNSLDDAPEQRLTKNLTEAVERYEKLDLSPKGHVA